jgi:hypothetical protein
MNQKLRYLLFFIGIVFSSLEGKGQNAIFGGDFANGWSNSSTESICFDDGAGFSRIGTFKPNGSNGDKFFRLLTCWDGNFNQWGVNGSNFNVSIGEEVTNVNENQTGAAYQISDANIDYNYVFKTRGAGNPPGNPSFIVFEVKGDIRTVTSVSQSINNGEVFFGDEVEISANLNDNLVDGQAIYLRYTSDNFTTSNVVNMTGSGTTYTATIPSSINVSNSTISYYVFTSGTNNMGEALSINGNDVDFFTINLNNNNGSNFSYNVRPEYITKEGASNWNNANSWRANIVPPNDANVIVAHDLNLTDNREIRNTVIVTGATLSFSSSETLNIQNGGNLTNNGTLFHNSGTLIFLGSGSISGEVALHNLEINGEVNAGNTTTVANETKIKAGGFFSTNAPRFLENSILVYDTGGNYARGIEWNNDDTSTSGTPHHVKIESGTTLFMQSTSNFTSDATILGDLIIDGGTFNMNNFTHSDVTVNDIEIINVGALTVGNTTSGDPVEGRSIIAQGDFFNTNGSVTLGDGFQGDLKVRGSQLVYLTENSTFNSQGRAIVFDGEQDISITSTGEIVIDFVVIDMPSGKVIIDNDLTIQGLSGTGGESGILLQMQNQATLDLNVFDLFLGGSVGSETFDVVMGEDAKIISTPTTVITILNDGDTQLRLDESNQGVTNAVKKLIVNNEGKTIISNDLHIFESLEVDEAEVDGNDKLIFRSSENQTAVIAEIKNEGEVTGSIRTERFYKMGNRGFRYVSPSVTSTASINTQWQEGINNTGTNYPDDNEPFQPGFGTHITGSATGENGFDATLSGNPSMFTWDNDVSDPVWAPIPNTDATNLEAGKAYALMMRGDRSANLNDNEATGNSTTLRAQGTPLYGTQEITTGVGTGNFAFIGNPYQAQIDLTKVTKSNFGNFFYIWDPTIGEIGGYAAVEIDAVGYQGTTPSSGTEANQFLQVGQAFFIQATDISPSITFQESYKSENTDNLATFSVPNHATVNINLLRNENLLVDGLRISLADAFDDEVNFSDATKLWSQQEHFAIDKNPHWLMVEKRSIPENESILFYLDNYFSSNYQFNINIQQLATHKIFLHDAYLEESFELNNNGENTYSFEVDSNIQASKGPNRFSLYFEEISLATETLEVETLVVYPNPTSETVNIQLPQSTNGEEIHLSIRDLLGKTVLQKKVKQTETQLQLKFPKNVPSGTYLLKAQTKEKQFSTKLIKK